MQIEKMVTKEGFEISCLVMVISSTWILNSLTEVEINEDEGT